MSDVLTLAEAEDLLARTLAAIDHYAPVAVAVTKTYGNPNSIIADRERVASDLDGPRVHQAYQEACEGCYGATGWPCDDARRYSGGLRRTAALYGVSP